MRKKEQIQKQQRLRVRVRHQPGEADRETDGSTDKGTNHAGLPEADCSTDKGTNREARP